SAPWSLRLYTILRSCFLSFFYFTFSAHLFLTQSRQWADCSSPFYNFEPKRGFNPANGSWADTSSPLLFILNPINRSDLNYPPTSVGRDSYFRSNLHIERT